MNWDEKKPSPTDFRKSIRFPTSFRDSQIGISFPTIFKILFSLIKHKAPPKFQFLFNSVQILTQTPGYGFPPAPRHVRLMLSTLSINQIHSRDSVLRHVCQQISLHFGLSLRDHRTLLVGPTAISLYVRTSITVESHYNALPEGSESTF